MSKFTAAGDFLPGWLMQALNFGMAYPKGDEDDLFALGDAWKQAAAALEALEPDLRAATDKVPQYYTGEGATAAATEFALLFDGKDYSIQKLVESLEALGKDARTTATDIEYTKIQSEIFALLTLSTVLSLLPTLWGSAAVPSVLAVARVGLAKFAAQMAEKIAARTAAAGLRSLAKPLSRELVIPVAPKLTARQLAGQVAKGAGVGAGLGGLMDGGIQAGQIMAGRRDDGFDVRQFVKTVTEWGAGGAFGAPAHSLLGAGIKRVPSLTSKPAMLTEGLAGAGAGAVGGVGMWGAGIGNQLYDFHNDKITKVDYSFHKEMLIGGVVLGGGGAARHASVAAKHDGSAPYAGDGATKPPTNEHAADPKRVADVGDRDVAKIHKSISRDLHPDAAGRYSDAGQQARESLWKQASDVHYAASLKDATGQTGYTAEHVTRLEQIRDEGRQLARTDPGPESRANVPSDTGRSGDGSTPKPADRAGAPSAPRDAGAGAGSRPSIPESTHRAGAGTGTTTQNPNIAAATQGKAVVADVKPSHAPVVEVESSLPAGGRDATAVEGSVPHTSDRVPVPDNAKVIEAPQDRAQIPAENRPAPAENGKTPTSVAETSVDHPQRPVAGESPDASATHTGSGNRPEAKSPSQPYQGEHKPSKVEEPNISDEMGGPAKEGPENSKPDNGEVVFDDYLPDGAPVRHDPTSTTIGHDQATQNVRKNVLNEGEHDVILHGSPEGEPIPGFGNAVHPEQVVQAILNNPHYVAGTPVRLLACFSGNEVGWAQYVADRLGAQVRAPSDKVGTPQAPNSPAVIWNNGEWVTRSPRNPVDPATPSNPLHEPSQSREPGTEGPGARRSVYEDPPGWDFMGKDPRGTPLESVHLDGREWYQHTTDKWSAMDAVEIADRLRSEWGVEATHFEYPGLHPEVFREFARGVEDMQTRYPDVRLPEISIARLPEGCYAETVPRIENGQASTKRIVLNGDYALDPRQMTDHVAQDVVDGHFVPGSGDRPFYSTFVHEYGHTIDLEGQMRARSSAEQALEDYFTSSRGGMDRAAFDAWMDELTGYSFQEDGRFNPAEALAEAFTYVELYREAAPEPTKVLYWHLLDNANWHSTSPNGFTHVPDDAIARVFEPYRPDRPIANTVAPEHNSAPLEAPAPQLHPTELTPELRERFEDLRGQAQQVAVAFGDPASAAELPGLRTELALTFDELGLRSPAISEAVWNLVHEHDPKLAEYLSLYSRELLPAETPSHSGTELDPMRSERPAREEPGSPADSSAKPSSSPESQVPAGEPAPVTHGPDALPDLTEAQNPATTALPENVPHSWPVDPMTGYEIKPRDLEFLGLTSEQVHAWMAREAPLGMTPEIYGDWRTSLLEALHRDGVDTRAVDIRLRGSGADFFSGAHKQLPTLEELAGQPEAQARLREWLGEDLDRPVSRPYDSMYKLGLEEPSDFDLNISSHEMFDRAAAVWDPELFEGQLSKDHGYLNKSLITAEYPHLLRWAEEWSARLGREMSYAVFTGTGPKDVSAQGFYVHFQATDWIIHDPGRLSVDVGPDGGLPLKPVRAVDPSAVAERSWSSEFSESIMTDHGTVTRSEDAKTRVIQSITELMTTPTGRLLEAGREVHVDPAMHLRLGDPEYVVALRNPDYPSMGGTLLARAELDPGNPAHAPEYLLALDVPGAERVLRQIGVSELIQSWAHDSNGTNVKSLAIQEAAAAEFGLSNILEWRMTEELRAIVDREIADYGDVHRELLRAQYERTQQQLASEGVNSLILYRAVSWSPEDFPAWAAGQPGAVLDMPQQRPLSSWTGERRIASDWLTQHERPGVILAATFSRESILAYPQTGIGCLWQVEFVPLARPGSVTLDLVHRPPDRPKG
ncbi:hypothetical protein [Nocardia sp. NPDC057668]|uniref:WXG100-like domain-containing protein n=1 Tax=Nocardia sp. NPDC057668 TaxID=3346202 RepID=UPI00366D812E